MSTEEALKQALEDLQEIVKIRKEKATVPDTPQMKLLRCNPSPQKGGFDLRFLNIDILNKKLYNNN